MLIIFTRIGCTLLTCDMYMSDVRHIHVPVLSSLKMEGIFIPSWFSVLGHGRPSALRLLSFLQALRFPMVLTVILISRVSCASWNLHTALPVQRIALSIWFTSTLKPNLLVGQRKQVEGKLEECQECHYTIANKNTEKNYMVFWRRYVTFGDIPYFDVFCRQCLVLF
jgi:hypothetical protein